MPDANRVHQVCNACKLRKKACDKALPACGFCTTRRLHCRYDVSASSGLRGRRRYNPGRHFVPLQTLSPPSVSAQDKAATGHLPSSENKQGHSPTHQSSFYVLPHSSVEESLNQLAQHFFGLTNLTRDIFIDHYFQPVHKWLPLVSPNSFRREASRYREEGRLPSADFTVLTLAMLLIFLPTLDPSLRPPRATQEHLYMATKSAFSQAQACISTSLRLAQAGLLIALREYSCVRQEAAYTSVMTCTGLIRVLGIGTISMIATTDTQTASDSSWSEDMERENLAGAVAMLERLVLCEMDQRGLRPQTEYPNQFTLQSLDAVDSGQMRRQAQSVSLLDRLLCAMHLPTNKENKLAELVELDSEIRSFIKLVMAESEWMATPHCIHVALCVRLLFLLHVSVLDTLQGSQSETDQQRRDISLSGLDMVCRLTLDVADWHGEGQAQMMPICCFCNLRQARKRMQERNRLVIDEGLSRDIGSLLRAEEQYRTAWVF